MYILFFMRYVINVIRYRLYPSQRKIDKIKSQDSKKEELAVAKKTRYVKEKFKSISSYKSSSDPMLKSGSNLNNEKISD